MKRLIFSGFALVLLLLSIPSASNAEIGIIPQTMITHSLSFGMKGDEVSALQQILENKGFFMYPNITGYFGPITKNSVITFQQTNGISPLGIVGPLTRAKLYEISPMPMVVTPTLPVNHYVNPPSHHSDKIAPTISITSPSEDDDISGIISLTASASDNKAVVGVQFKVDDVNVGSEDISSPYSIDWDSTSTEEGTHIITAIARDAAGNTTTSESISANVDNTPPAVSVSFPPNLVYFSTTTPVFTVDLSDNVGIAGAKFQVDGVDATTEYAGTGLSGHSLSVTVEGAHILTAIARDAAGNITTSDPYTFYIDTIAPEVSISSPVLSIINSGPITLFANITEAQGIASNSVVYRIYNAVPPNTVEYSHTFISNPIPIVWSNNVDDGDYIFEVTATDLAGNVGTATHAFHKTIDI